MARFASTRPFSGVRQIKYEQLMETNREFVRSMEKTEFEEYLKTLERRYQDRCFELVEAFVKQAYEKNPGIRGTGAGYAAIEEATRRAEEIALQELLDA